MDAMVTARMSEGKKEVGNAILHELGTNASQFINDSYDYVIKTRRLPFQDDQRKRKEVDMNEAILFIDSIPLPSASRFASMTDEEIKQERLIARGIASEGDFS